MTAKKCKGRTKSGSPCKLLPENGTAWCWSHSPHRVEERHRRAQRTQERLRAERPGPSRAPQGAPEREAREVTSPAPLRAVEEPTRRRRPNRPEVSRERREKAARRGRSVARVELVEERQPEFLVRAMEEVSSRARVGTVPCAVLRHPQHEGFLGAVLVVSITDAAHLLELDDPEPVDRT